MTEAWKGTDQTRTIVVEQTMAAAPEIIWCALAQSRSIAEWLMPNDFEPVVGHKFTLRAAPVPGWKGFTNCDVLEVEAPRRLVYSWGDGTESESGLSTIVTWALIPTAGGTHVRLVQSGFRPKDEGGYSAMTGGWPPVIERLERAAVSG